MSDKGEFDQQRAGASVLGKVRTALIFWFFWIKPKEH